jgi:hypothetical protein
VLSSDEGIFLLRFEAFAWVVLQEIESLKEVEVDAAGVAGVAGKSNIVECSIELGERCVP